MLERKDSMWYQYTQQQRMVATHRIEPLSSAVQHETRLKNKVLKIHGLHFYLLLPELQYCHGLRPVALVCLVCPLVGLYCILVLLFLPLVGLYCMVSISCCRAVLYINVRAMPGGRKPPTKTTSAAAKHARTPVRVSHSATTATGGAGLSTCADVVCDLCCANIRENEEDAVQCEGACGMWYTAVKDHPTPAECTMFVVVVYFARCFW